MNSNSKAKSLITGETEPLNESPEGMETPPPRGPGGPPRRPGGPGGPMRRPGGPGGPGGPSGGVDQQALAQLVILDLLHALNYDKFYTEIADLVLKGAPITPDKVRHFLDEAPKYADKMSPEVNALMEKISQMPMA